MIDMIDTLMLMGREESKVPVTFGVGQGVRLIAAVQLGCLDEGGTCKP
jgi:hypothetical protein